jgi:hypothetical protein
VESIAIMNNVFRLLIFRLSLPGLGKTLQTIALIVTDDTGVDVMDEPEEPDPDFDDMTIISSFNFVLSTISQRR